MASLVSNGPYQVVVWEWHNDFQAWEPYEPSVVNVIEKQWTDLSAKSPVTDRLTFSLTRHFPDPFPSHEIDIAVKKIGSVSDAEGFQRNVTTGTQRKIRRKLISSNEPGGVADGIFWKWKGDNRRRPWNSYPTEISQRIERVKRDYDQGLSGPSVNLETSFPSFPYSVDVARCEQKKNSTRWVREIRREITIHFPRVDGANIRQVSEVKKGTSASENRIRDTRSGRESSENRPQSLGKSESNASVTTASNSPPAVTATGHQRESVAVSKELPVPEGIAATHSAKLSGMVGEEAATDRAPETGGYRSLLVTRSSASNKPMIVEKAGITAVSSRRNIPISTSTVSARPPTPHARAKRTPESSTDSDSNGVCSTAKPVSKSLKPNEVADPRLWRDKAGDMAVYSQRVIQPPASLKPNEVADPIFLCKGAGDVAVSSQQGILPPTPHVRAYDASKGDVARADALKSSKTGHGGGLPRSAVVAKSLSIASSGDSTSKDGPAGRKGEINPTSRCEPVVKPKILKSPSMKAADAVKIAPLGNIDALPNVKPRLSELGRDPNFYEQSVDLPRDRECEKVTDCSSYFRKVHAFHDKMKSR